MLSAQAQAESIPLISNDRVFGTSGAGFSLWPLVKAKFDPSASIS
jgi:hypothetical protein